MHIFLILLVSTSDAFLAWLAKTEQRETRKAQKYKPSSSIPSDHRETSMKRTR